MKYAMMETWEVAYQTAQVQIATSLVQEVTMFFLPYALANQSITLAFLYAYRFMEMDLLLELNFAMMEDLEGACLIVQQLKLITLAQVGLQVLQAFVHAQ